MSWRFADRGWFFNDNINLRSDANLAVVAEALVFPNIAFGLHRWFAGGQNPTYIAVTSSQEWETELLRGRPGDNLMLLSLRDVASQALLHLGALTGPPLRSVSHADLKVVWDFLADDDHDVHVIHRYSPHRGEVTCSHDSVWDPSPEECAALIEEWQATGGELWFFDGAILWQDDATRLRHLSPPEDWTAQHGMFLVDGVVPDAEGRVVCGGPY